MPTVARIGSALATGSGTFPSCSALLHSASGTPYSRRDTRRFSRVTSTLFMLTDNFDPNVVLPMGRTPSTSASGIDAAFRARPSNVVTGRRDCTDKASACAFTTRSGSCPRGFLA